MYCVLWYILVTLIDKFIFGYKLLYKKDCEIFKFFKAPLPIKAMHQALEI